MMNCGDHTIILIYEDDFYRHSQRTLSQFHISSGFIRLQGKNGFFPTPMKRLALGGPFEVEDT